jgi:DNA-binding NarL/FixJ family response regulator
MNEDNDIKQRKVLLVDDHPMFRERLAQLINKDLHLAVCGEADNIPDALRLIREKEPNIAIVDIALNDSNGLDLIKDLRAQGNSLPVLVISMYDEVLYAERALRAGANGYITKSHTSAEVRLAIQSVLGGDLYLSPSMTNRVLRRLSKCPEGGEPVPALLTERELQVFRLLGCGRNSREIGEELGLGTMTVNCYRFRIREKLEVKHPSELYNRAAEWVKEHGA